MAIPCNGCTCLGFLLRNKLVEIQDIKKLFITIQKRWEGARRGRCVLQLLLKLDWSLISDGGQ
jgi:hypothetical protein